MTTNKKTNLRFLLALAINIVVVLIDADTVSVYSDNRPSGPKNRLSVERLADAVSSR